MLNKSIKIIYLIFFSYFFISGPLKPIANWDMLAYVGSVNSYISGNNNLREKSLADVQNYVSPLQFQSFIKGSNYVETVANDDTAFNQQLPAYKLKPFYIFLTSIVSNIVGNVSMASVIVSSFGFLTIGFALFLMRPKDNFLQNIYLISVLLTLYISEPKFILFCNAATPDSLAISLFLLGIVFLLINNNFLISSLFFSLSILTRPDSIVTFICLIPFIYKLQNDKYFFNLNSILNSNFLNYEKYFIIVIPFFTYGLSSFLFPGLSLKELIIFSNNGPYPYVSNIDTSNFWEIYFITLKNSLFSMLSFFRFSIFILLNLFFLFLYKDKLVFYILLAAVCNIFLKIILFPNFDHGYFERYLCISYFLIIFSIFNSNLNIKIKS